VEQIKLAQNGRTYVSRADNVSEHKDQVDLFVWAGFNAGKYPELKMLFAIPNGGKRDAITGAMLKSEGVRRGVPDICLAVARGKYHGLFIELKRADLKPSAKAAMQDFRKMGLSVYQSEWLDALRAEGYAAGVCYGYEEARDAILDYLKGKKWEKL